MTLSASTSALQPAQRLPLYLPAIYRDNPFVGQYLWAFEQLLLDLERQISTLASVFDPMEAREEFLPWLSSWVAFTLRADLDPIQQRRFLARIIPLYRRRGTLKNLQDLLAIFTTGLPTVEEADDPHHFRVTLRLPQAAPAVQLRQIAIAHALIDLEKPAHTFYDLNLLVPTMQIGVTSHIGVDTLLGTIDGVAAQAPTQGGLPTPDGLARATLSRPKVSWPKAAAKRPASPARKDTPRKKSAAKDVSVKSRHRKPASRPTRPSTRRRKRDIE
jgi:phage tail-like protein